MLQPTAAAASEIRTRRLDAVRRREEHRLDHRASEATARFDQSHAQSIAWKPTAHENHVPVDASDTFAAERQVLDRELERLAATRFRHGPSHYKRRSETSQFDEDFAVYHTDQ